MRVHVLNTGTELLLGDVLNTHLSFIARQIFAVGLRVERHATVPDGDAIKHALLASFEKAEIMFVTGGLGPTTDDLTRDIVAELLGLALKEDAAVAATITARLRAHRYPMTDRILRQAQVPEGATVLPNQNGTAPGLYLAAIQRGGMTTPHLFLLPGPPRELHPMFSESVLPILRQIAPGGMKTDCRTFGIACVGESMVEAAVGRQLLALSDIELGYCAHAGAVDVRVLGPTAAVDEAERIIRDAFGKSIYTTAGETLEQVVVAALAARQQTLVTAESCTGGYLAHRVTNVAGSSAVFPAGNVTYANESKSVALGVPLELIEQHGAVSEPVAQGMAEGAREQSNASYALATTGIAGPGGGSDEKPVGTVFVALASADAATEVQRFRFMTDRQTFKHLATQRALEMLRQRLIAV
ncbi:MAG: competence/damage-inducible protein A [Chthoniobacterales bacterium]|nr:competence/damage-inducible protein A [Chthoniobacterales bacterium]